MCFKGLPSAARWRRFPGDSAGLGTAAPAAQHFIFATAHLSPVSQARAPGAEQLGHLPRTRPWDRTRPGHRCQALTQTGSSWTPSLPSRPHDPTLAQRPGPPRLRARKRHKGSCTAHAQKAHSAEGSAPSGASPRSGVLAPPGTLFINTPRGSQRGVTLKVVGSEVRGQRRRRWGDPSLHLHKPLPACRAQPGCPAAVWGR